ncbi:MAG: hypothetical protein H7318_12890 [Oligoflexus sp.]|nr:hypothetical protein [Oligoflexus sp.]
MKKFGDKILQEKYANYHIDDFCVGRWEQIVGSDMPYKVEDGISILLQNPPIVRCNVCGAQFFVEGFEKRMLRSLVHIMLFDHRPLNASHIRFARSFAGLTQTEIANELDIRKEAMSRYESRKEPQPMQPGEQVRFKLLLISKLGFDIPRDAQLWKADKASLLTATDSLVRKIDARTLAAEAS